MTFIEKLIEYIIFLIYNFLIDRCDIMRLDGNLKKRKINEGITELSSRRKNIENYLLTKYGMDQEFATKVASVLEKTSLQDNMIKSGKYDSVIKMTIQQMDQNKVSSFSDTKYIREAEKKETLYSKDSTPSQQSNQVQQNTKPVNRDPVLDEKLRELREQGRRIREKDEQLRADIRMGRNRR